jgi:ribose 1,5-bisphosphokinase
MIGPGKLTVVVGPSGAGKDTLITLMRAQYQNDADIVFPRRVVTRLVSVGEDHDSLSEKAFEDAVQRGALAFWWEAHGLRYGVRAEIDADIQKGKTVVCNVSRATVNGLRSRFAHVIVVLVTAPEDVLAARLAARGRPSDGNIMDRLQRPAPPSSDIRPDVTIENVGDPQIAANRLSAVIRKYI